MLIFDKDYAFSAESQWVTESSAPTTHADTDNEYAQKRKALVAAAQKNGGLVAD